ncbi:arylsulfatase [Echinicola sp. 20G]|uniref:arylsulfatase n=1 Tax=Echinicola sp. 20G TaxID=2781961 RepID=UPI001910B452|nr:arylsulfatase [Echinicola sp. 20G]
MSFNLFFAIMSFLPVFFSCTKKESITIKQPNIILIVADDLGYSDLGCFGGEIQTPFLNSIANEGVRLPNMNNAGMCVISRSSLLTGQWWPKVGYGIEHGENIAQELKKEGYSTGLIGKWHLNGEPNEKGFDYFFGFLGGYSTYFQGSSDYRENKKIYKDFDNEFYSTDEFSERAVSFVNERAGHKDQPFFLYLSYQSPHNPLQAPKEDIMKYRGTYLSGWQAIREARVKRQKAIGLVNENTPLPGYPQNLPEWESLSFAQKDLEDLRMSVYAAMVERMDNGVGKLMESLKVNGLAENTLVIFLSDNGTDSFSVMDSVMLQKGVLPGDIGSNYQPGTGWAYASVTPRRLYKISQHGGGVKTGAIAWWPKTIRNSGTLLFDPLHVIDVFPTFLDVAGNMDKKSTDQNNTKVVAGESFAALLKGEEWERKSPMYFQFMDNRAIRTDKWSLVEVDGNGWELYDTETDPMETRDLSSQYPEKVNELDMQWLMWWKTESGKSNYRPESTHNSPHYKPQGDRGTGAEYTPSAMPANLNSRYPLKNRP